MIYGYVCDVCAKSVERDFKIGCASETVMCDCGGEAHRDFNNGGTVLKGSGWPSKSIKFNKNQTDNNKKAGERMKHRKPPVTRVATDYGGGDVRSV